MPEQDIETVWISSRTTGSNDVYHTDPDCKQLAASTNTRERPLELVEDNRRECNVCSGDVDAYRKTETSWPARMRQQAGESE